MSVLRITCEDEEKSLLGGLPARAVRGGIVYSWFLLLPLSEFFPSPLGFSVEEYSWKGPAVCPGSGPLPDLPYPVFQCCPPPFLLEGPLCKSGRDGRGRKITWELSFGPRVLISLSIGKSDSGYEGSAG